MTAEKKKSTKKKAPAKPKKKALKPKADKAPEIAIRKPAPAAVEFVARQPKKKFMPASDVKYSGTGRRKEAAAKVWLLPGEGKIFVNERDFKQYFCGRKLLEYQVLKPLVATNTLNSYNVYVEAFGGGVPAQAVAVSMGIARALLSVNPDFRKAL